MTSGAAQAVPPSEPFEKSRLTMTIFALVAIAFVLAGIFVYLEKSQGQNVAPTNNVLTAQAKAQYVSEMQAAVQQRPPLTLEQKTALMQSMSAQLKNNQ